MSKIDILYKEYNELKDNYLKNNSLNLKEDLKNKINELDYELNKDYEEKLNTNFPMTTTLDKEEKRLVSLIKFINEKKEEQKKITVEYKELTGQTIELSHLKNSELLTEYRQRLDLVKRFLVIKKDLTKVLSNSNDANNVKVKVLKNRLMKKEMLNLLYEFCLIDDLDIEDIDVEKIINESEEIKDMSKENTSKVEEKQAKKEDKKVELVPEIKVMPKAEIKIAEVKPVEVKQEEPKEEVLSSMPKIDRLGTVSPVNIYDTIKQTEEKLPDVVIPTNGLTEESSEIFIDTKKYFNN